MFRWIRNLLQNIVRRRRVERDLDDELHSSFEILVDRYIARGMPPDEARRAARLDFEGTEQVKEQVRETLAGSGIRALFQDLRNGWRALSRNRSFAAIALLTLALGIGVNTAV